MYIYNGEFYQKDSDCPNFGSVRLIGQFNEHGDNRYLFKDADKDKLNLLNKAGNGSLAYCTDKKYTLIKHCGVWVEV